MKYVILTIVGLLLSACSDIPGHADSETDFLAHQVYLEDIYTKYDPEYIDDCLYYEELVCEFE